MVSLQAFVVSLALVSGGGGGGSEVVLLDFTADWCQPCRMMAPVVQRLEDEGFPVRQINVDEQPHVAQQYKVQGIPCFVLLQDGQEVDRVTGAASYDLLARLFEKHGYSAAGDSTVRAQSPDDQDDQQPQWSQPATATDATDPAAPGRRSSDDVQQRALASSVRLRVEEAQGQAFGTGTIIDVRGDEALIVTCGHLFRDNKGNAAITVELLAPGASGSVPGELITYDAEDHDIALVAFRPGVPVAVAPVASGVEGIKPGAPVFSVGCDHGREPSVINSRIAAIDKYVGRQKYSHNIEVAGLPVDGRSGGGLFDAQGRLIGICNAADPTDNEGIYAGLKTIHSHLDEIQLTRIYRSAEPGEQQLGGTLVSNPSVIDGAQMDRAESTTDPDSDEPNLLAALDSGLEVICIVRGPNQKDEVLVLDQASRAMLSKYVRERSLPANVANVPRDSTTIRAQNGNY